MYEEKDPERQLTTVLRQIAAIDASIGSSAEVRGQLLAEVRMRRYQRRNALMKMYALAAGLVVATALPVWQLTTQPAPDVVIRPASPTGGGGTEVATAFYPLRYSDLPMTQGSVVRLAVPPTAFAALGVEPVDWIGSQPDTVMADVFVGEDGLARAVRFVRTVTNNTTLEQLP